MRWTGNNVLNVEQFWIQKMSIMRVTKALAFSMQTQRQPKSLYFKVVFRDLEYFFYNVAKIVKALLEPTEF